MSSPQGLNDVLLPKTESQRKRTVLQAARRARQAYRRADTAGEVLERWLDREIKRKTRIMPASVARGLQLYRAWFAQVRNVETAFADLGYMSSQL